MSTPRPTINISCDDSSYELYLVRHKALKKHIHSPHVVRRLVRDLREIQVKKFMEHSSDVSKAAARRSLQDPNPYDPIYIFYCLEKGAKI